MSCRDYRTNLVIPAISAISRFRHSGLPAVALAKGELLGAGVGPGGRVGPGPWGKHPGDAAAAGNRDIDNLGSEEPAGAVEGGAAVTRLRRRLYESAGSGRTGKARQSLRREVAEELLDRMKSMQPSRFEQLVVDLLVAMGYGGSLPDAGRAIGASGDGGIDGIIKEDKLGLDVVYIQAKRCESTVGRPVVQAFAGSLEDQRARKGVLITTSQFSQEARAYVDRIEKKIVPLDGEQVAQLMIDHGIGVAEVATYMVKRVDLDYFGTE
jgi:hypothetical protein